MSREMAYFKVDGGETYEVVDASARGRIDSMLASFGSPLVANTVAEMVDHDKVYVYTGNESGYTAGNWYYHNGSTWVSGGTYNSTAIGDGTITDAKLAQSGGILSEVQDIRNGYDGTVYDTAGEAVRAQIRDLRDMLDRKVGDGYVEEGTGYFTNGDDGGNQVLFTMTGMGGGGGGGGGGDSTNAKMSAINTTGWISTSVTKGSEVILSFNWSSIEDGMSTGAGSLAVTVNRVTKLSNRTINQGGVSIDVSSYLDLGQNSIVLIVSDVYGQTKRLAFNVTVASYTLTSQFDQSAIYTSAFTYSSTATGAGSKTMHFKIDGTEIGTMVVTTSGVQTSYTIPAQSHGAHTIESYFTVELNGETVESNHLYHAFVYAVAGYNTVIIASPFNTTSIGQYTTLPISYLVYNPSSLSTEITLNVDETVINTLTVDRSIHIWSYRCDMTGAHTLAIKAGTVTKSFNIRVTESDMDIAAETSDLVLYLTAKNRSNSELNPAVWTYNGISCEFRDFNWVSDGWKLDEDNNTVCRVTGDGRLYVPYQIFGTDFRSTGKTIEIDFATRDVRNYDAEIITCWSGNRGLKVTPQSITLKSANTETSTMYKDGEHLRVAFSIQKRNEHRFIHTYINGVKSGVKQYSSEDDFAQLEPVGISIGSNDATVDIYTIRIYDNGLNRYQMLRNWIADTPNVDLMLERYRHNDIYDEYGQIVISKLPGDLPYLIIEGPELPQSKGDKKTVNITYVDPTDNSKSFTALNVQIDVQGTSSQYYARKNYKMKFKNGFIINGETVAKYALRGEANSIPTDTFTFKADVASSEGANNVELCRLNNDTNPWKSPAQKEDPRIRQSIDGFPIVIFWNDGTNTTFIGKYNFNNDKGTEEVFGFTEGDESWEIKNNTSDRVLWKSTDYSGTDWLNDFEARYPDTDPPYADPTQLKSMAEWIDSVKNDPAKFRAELADHMEVDSVIFYYLITEFFLMVDSRAKNAFPSFVGGEM